MNRKFLIPLVIVLPLLVAAYFFWPRPAVQEDLKRAIHEFYEAGSYQNLVEKTAQDKNLKDHFYPIVAQHLLAKETLCPEEGLSCARFALSQQEGGFQKRYNETTLLIAKSYFEEALKANEELKIDLLKVNDRSPCLYALVILRKAALSHHLKLPFDSVRQDFVSMSAKEAACLKDLCGGESFKDFVASNPLELVRK